MQFVVAVVVICPLLVTSAVESPANSLAWRPHEFDDVQDLVAKEAQSLQAKQSTKIAPAPQQAKLSLAAQDTPAVYFARHTSKIERDLAKPALGDYLGVKRPAGKEFSTQWNAKPWNDVSGHVVPKSFAWRPSDDLEVTRASPLAPKAPLVPYSRLLSDEMKDAVVVAESLKAETNDMQPQAKALRAATDWQSPGTRPVAHRSALAQAESRVAARVAQENPYMTMLGESQKVTEAARAVQGSGNLYEAYLASDKEQFKARVHDAEAQGERAEARDNGYFRSVVPDSTYLTLAGL